MDTTLLRKHLSNLLSAHAPVKARKLSQILADEFGQHVDRSDVNSALYGAICAAPRFQETPQNFSLRVEEV